MHTRNVKKPGTVTIGASETATVVSDVLALNKYQCFDAFHYVVKCSGITETTGFTFYVQESFDGGTSWADAGAQLDATLSAGNAEARCVRTDATDAAQMPLWPHVRIVVDSGSSDALTVDSVYVSGFDVGDDD